MIDMNTQEPCDFQHVTITDGYYYRSGTWFDSPDGGFILLDKDTPFEILYWFPTSQDP